MRVIPNINCDHGDFHCAAQRLAHAQALGDWVHLDIADGVFTFAKSWGSPEEWKKLVAEMRADGGRGGAEVKLEVHLMVEHPERVAEEWLLAGARRVVFHYEAFPRAEANPERVRARAIEKILRMCEAHGAEAMLAINPETSLEQLPHHLERVGAFQVFAQAVVGPAGQRFLPTVLPKIRALRERFPDATIEVDGGITLETARRVKEAGADTVVCGSYILSAADPRAAYEALRAL